MTTDSHLSPTPFLLFRQKISADLHLLVQGANIVNALIAHELEDDVLTLRETEINLCHVRAGFAWLRFFG